MRGNIPFSGANYRFYSRRVHTIFHIVFGQQKGSRDDNRPKFMQRQDKEPKLVMAFEDNHNHIALFYAF
jgi:hypothetical protein